MKVKVLQSCRVCGGDDLRKVVDLGEQELTGVFPKTRDEQLTSGPLQLVFCPKCGLLQLAHSYELTEMYGENYGYRSGLNSNMVAHLTNKVEYLEHRYNLTAGDVVVDIGSNDGTTLNAYKTKGIRRIGIDPTGAKFQRYYNEGVELVPDFFSVINYRSISDKAAKIVTSISMFYDLESPTEFAAAVEEILADDGIWHFEQSYMPTMLRQNAYDTICHEHLEYYSLQVIQYILTTVGMKIIDVRMNDVNGGSFAVTAAKKHSSYKTDDVLVGWLLEREAEAGLHTEEPYKKFAERVKKHKQDLSRLVDLLNMKGKKVYGYGASTKGNVVLQYCHVTDKQIAAIGEVNEDKFGAFTPGTHIPIKAEEEIKALQPDYLLVLPWHFRNMILGKEKEYVRKGGKFIFPLPYIEII